jgi:hypothetical protein
MAPGLLLEEASDNANHTAVAADGVFLREFPEKNADLA